MDPSLASMDVIPPVSALNATAPVAEPEAPAVDAPAAVDAPLAPLTQPDPLIAMAEAAAADPNPLLPVPPLGPPQPVLAALPPPAPAQAWDPVPKRPAEGAPGAEPKAKKPKEDGVILLTAAQCRSAVPPLEALLEQMKQAFVDYSSGAAWVADVQHVTVGDEGDACVKTGYVKGAAAWVVKVAGGFPGNGARGLSPSQGAMLLFSQKTGRLEAVLADEGRLTDVRTAAAAALCVREFKAEGAKTLAVFGTGVVAALVAEFCASLFSEGELLVVSRSEERAAKRAVQAEEWGWLSARGASAAEAAACADAIVTCTPATEPVLTAAVRPHAVVVALGADAEGKRELGPAVLEGATLLVDSRKQCLAFGEAKHFAGEPSPPRELGEHFANPGAPAGPIVCDLTGVAVQDVAIAAAVQRAAQKGHVKKAKAPKARKRPLAQIRKLAGCPECSCGRVAEVAAENARRKAAGQHNVALKCQATCNQSLWIIAQGHRDSTG